MGIDVVWGGSQPDRERQRECAGFLRRVAETLWWDYELFDGGITGPHVSLEWGRPPRYRKRLPLLGITIYPCGKESLRQTGELDGQASFVFDNGLKHSAPLGSSESTPPPPFDEPRPPQRGEIITFERWTDRPKHRWKARPHTRGLYDYGSAFRMVGDDPEYLAWLLLYVRERFVPNLEADDDYGAFRQVEAEARTTGWLEELSRGAPQGNAENELVNQRLRKLWWSSCVGERVDLAGDWKSHVATLAADRPELPALAEIAAEFPAPRVPLEQISINLLELDHSEQIPLVVQGVRSVADLLTYSDADLATAFRESPQAERYAQTIKQSLHFALTKLSSLPLDQLLWFHLPSMRDGQLDMKTAVRSRDARAIEEALKGWADKVRSEDYASAYRLCVWEGERRVSLAEFGERLRAENTLRGSMKTIELLRPPLVIGDRAVARARLAYTNEGSTLVNFRDQAMLRRGHTWKLLW